MKTILPVLALLAVALWAPRAQAQESHKFSAKALQAKFDVPIYPPKGHVVNDEYIAASDEYEKITSAVYVLKGDAKKAIEFYTKELGDPKQEESDTGLPKWTFKAKDLHSSRFRHRVMITYDKGEKLVQITLWQREYNDPADADN